MEELVNVVFPDGSGAAVTQDGSMQMWGLGIANRLIGRQWMAAKMIKNLIDEVGVENCRISIFLGHKKGTVIDGGEFTMRDGSTGIARYTGSVVNPWVCVNNSGTYSLFL